MYSGERNGSSPTTRFDAALLLLLVVMTTMMMI